MVTAEATVVIRNTPEERAVLPFASSVYMVTIAPVGMAASAQKDKSAGTSCPISSTSGMQVITGVAISRRTVIQITLRLNICPKSLLAIMLPMRNMARGEVRSASQPTGVMIISGIRISAASNMVPTMQV